MPGTKGALLTLGSFSGPYLLFDTLLGSHNLNCDFTGLAKVALEKHTNEVVEPGKGTVICNA